LEEKQLLREADVEPTSEVLAAALGAANAAYVKFLAVLSGREMQVGWRFYNDGKAWLGKGLYRWENTRGTEKETVVFWLSVWEGFFKVTFFVPEKHRADALALPLGAAAHKLVEDGKQMGKLKFFPVVFELRTEELFEEIIKLVDFKKALK